MRMRSELYIDGTWVPSSSGETIDVVNPATEEVIHSFAAAAAPDVDRAVKAARRAFDRDGWPKLSGARRAAFLRAIAEGIRSRQAELARLEVIDNGKPLPEAEWDIGDAAACFDYYAGLAEEFDRTPAEAIALPDDRFTSKVVREAVGVVGAIIPWNYPLLMAAWKVAPALAAGDRRASAGRQAGLHRVGQGGCGDHGHRRPRHQGREPRAGREVALRHLRRCRHRAGGRMDHVRHFLESGAGVLGDLAGSGAGRHQ
jgi:hypothetical protein